MGWIGRLAFALAAGLAWSSPSLAQQGDPVELAFRPHPGAEWQTESRFVISIEAWMGPREDRSKTLQRTRMANMIMFANKVGERDLDGNSVMTTSPMRMSRDMSSYALEAGETSNKFDTEAADPSTLDPETRDFVTQFKAVRFYRTLDPQGRMVDYRAEPEGNPLTATLAAGSASELGNDTEKFPDHPVRVGDKWQIGPLKGEATISGEGTGALEYMLDAELVAIETRNGARHALVRMVANTAKHLRDETVPGYGLEGFKVSSYYEFDLDQGRRVDAKLEMVFGLWAFEIDRNDLIHAEQRLETREHDVNGSGWMIDPAVAAGDKP